MQGERCQVRMAEAEESLGKEELSELVCEPVASVLGTLVVVVYASRPLRSGKSVGMVTTAPAPADDDSHGRLVLLDC